MTSIPQCQQIRKQPAVADGGKAANGIGCIKVLCSGCKNCRALYEAAKEAVKKLDLPLEVEYITDMEKVMAYDMMRMTALVLGDKVISMGQVLKAAEVKKLPKG